MYVELRRMVGNRRTVSTGIQAKQEEPLCCTAREAVRTVYNRVVRRSRLLYIIHFDSTFSVDNVESVRIFRHLKIVYCKRFILYPILLRNIKNTLLASKIRFESLLQLTLNNLFLAIER